MPIRSATIGQVAFEMSETDERDFGPWQKEESSRRRFRRWPVDIQASINIGGGRYECVVHNLSPGDARIVVENTEAYSIGTEVVLTFDEYGSIPAEVRYVESSQVGLMFIQDKADEVRLARFLVSLQPARRPSRQMVKKEGVLKAGRVQFDCVVENLSRFGASVLADAMGHFMEGSEVVLEIEGYGEIAATVRHVEENRIGLMFLEMLVGELPV